MKLGQEDRHNWAVKALQLKGTHSIAEIGCGPGLATKLIADKIKKGPFFVLDKSAAMIRRARAQVADPAKIQFVTGSLKTGCFEDLAFDKIFCFNVNVFWTDPRGRKGEFEALREALKKSGRLYVFFQLPSGKIDLKFIKNLTATFLDQGFKLLKVLKNPQPEVKSFGLVLRKK